MLLGGRRPGRARRGPGPGRPEQPLSLTEARRNFQTVGACEERFVHSVRDPQPDEYPQG
ncbi:CPCC family cysteine-rich protein [Kitasatospora arboriphila]